MVEQLANRLVKQVTATLLVAASTVAMAGGCSENPPPSRPTESSAHSNANPLSASAQTAEPARTDEPIAMVNGKPIGREQLVKPLVEAYGLNLLLQIIQLELSRQDAAKAGVAVTPTDIRSERSIMLKGFFPEAELGDYDQLLVQLLKQQGITQPQWEILLETNASLRKMAIPLCAGKITDDNIKQAFDVQYGGMARIRDIQISNIAEAQEVKRRLAAGEKFEDVARAMSRDPRIAALGGEWPPFSAKSTTVSDVIKQQAFGLKVGEVSDALNTEGVFHVIKVEERMPPKLAKFDEPTRESLRNALMDGLIQNTMKVLRNQLAAEAMQPNIMQIKDPELKKQFDQKVDEHKQVAQEEENARRQQTIKRLFPATAPASPLPPTTLPTRTESGDRPPATKSGAATLPAVPDASKK